MRTAIIVFLLCVSPLVAQQQRGMYGGVSTGQMVGIVNDPGFGSRLGATVSGLPQTTTRIPVGSGVYSAPGLNDGQRWNSRGGRTMIVPYGIPVGYYGGYEQQPATTIVQQPIQPAPSVIINQYYSPEVANPVMREYSNLPEPPRGPRTEVEQGNVRVEPPTARPSTARSQAERRTPQPSDQVVAERIEGATKATITLLSFTDSSIISAIAYWRQGDQLHYVSSDYGKHSVPLDTLDRSATELLNRDRKIEFQLEAMR